MLQIPFIAFTEVITALNRKYSPVCYIFYNIWGTMTELNVLEFYYAAKNPQSVIITQGIFNSYC